MKILQTPSRFHPYVGGVEKYILELSSHLVELGHQVTVICSDEPKSSLARINGIQAIRLRYVAKIANTNISLGLLLTLFRQDFDVIHSHMPTPWSADMSALVSVIRRKPLVLTYHNDLVITGKTGLIARVYNATFLQFVLRRAAKIVITQESYLEYSRYLSRYRRKVTAIPLGVSSPSPVTVTREPLSLFFLSVLDRHHEYKGLNVLLEALVTVKERFPKVHLKVGGGGELIGKYQEVAAKLGVASNVTFLGFVPEKDKGNQFASSVAFILPSTSSLEGFGIVALEASSYGTAVITTDLAGSANYIRAHRAGKVVASGDSHALAAAIITLISDPKAATEMGERGRLVVLHEFNWLTIAGKIADVYEEVNNRHLDVGAVLEAEK